MRPAHALVALLALAACDGPVATDAGLDAGADAGQDAGPPDPPGLPWLRDDRGGVIVLRGTNVSGDSKDPPDFAPNDFVSEADFARLRDELGMNAVRYLVFWEAVEPERGVYDDAYLAEVRRRVEAAGAAGLHVIVDMHQDVFGRGFGFDGAPAWACDQALYDSFDANRPAEWYLGYARPEVQQCFDRLYGDAELRAAFASAWRHVAEALRGAPGVFAYEVLNEPHWGSAAVRQFERTTLPAFYAECVDAIRAGDPEPYVFVAPASTANVGLPSSLVPPGRARLAYAPHVYPPGLEQGTGWTGTRASLDEWLAGLRADATRMALPLVVTELGARPDVPGAITFLHDVYDALDAAGFSATQWDAGRGGYGLYDADLGTSEIGAAIARPHPARIAGVPTGFAWSRASGVLTVTWEEDGSAAGETVITAPTLAFPRGFDVALDRGEARIEGTSVVVPQLGGARSLTLVAAE